MRPEGSTNAASPSEKRIGRYTVLRRLGAGAMAQVYAVKHVTEIAIDEE